jgi:hypothetical protein
MLKLITKEVPVELKDYYTEQADGLFKLNVEGVVSVEEHKTVKDKIKEFRDTNVKLTQQVETFTNVFGDGKDLTPAAISEKINSLAEARANSRATEMKTNYETRIKDLETGLSATSTRYSKLVLGKQVQDAVTKHGVHSSAIDDVLRRAEDAFEIKEDKLVYKSDKLDKEGKAFTVDTWAAELAKQAPHLFASSQGTGAVKPTNGMAPINNKVSGVARISQGLSNLAGGGNKSLA